MRVALSAVIVLALWGSASAEPPKTAPTNPTLEKMAPNVWLKLHEQGKDDPVRFMRQAHGGSCFDSARNRVVLFGSNTHGRDWMNSPRFFDPAAASWSVAYPDDDPKSYAVTEAGLPVAGDKGAHPWATHTFGSLEYDQARDELVDVCYPGHMVPGRFSNALKDLWPKVKTHPTWTFDCKTSTWKALPCKPVHFFPTCAAYAADRKSVLGYRPDGIYELAGEPREWKRLTNKVFLGGWHNNAVYDLKNKALVVFGTNSNSNDIEAFWPESGQHKIMPTPGARPAKDQHNPMAYLPTLGKVAVVVDRKLEPDNPKSKQQAELWLYDLAADAWTAVASATLDQPVGMNYNMEYDPRHDCLLLVTGDYGQPTRVWACRVKLADK